ncbi:MAG: YraN family protein [Gammaproteobacteria bacterium]|nr:YraN family protein [Gammaproteobacteria bacterium]MCP5407282.1 YraN family protein [Chromatiaceae bacterium]MCP5409086.1 YraN family protein [Chromatiaceae bacterium]MCP5441978.1 YraN family protein [Chromatiaceae bacterium]
MIYPREKGDEAEEQALKHLLAQGMRVVERNFYSHRGEIDLVMLDADSLVFVEVRSRNNGSFGSAAESVTWKKQLRVVQAAKHFLQVRTQWANYPCRFDVIAITGKQGEKVDWIKDAFQPIH